INSWGVNTDGSGAHPYNFVTDGQTFHVYNGTSASILGYWQVSGIGSLVNIGNGTNPITFNANDVVEGFVNVNNLATLKINSDRSPTFGSIASGSVIEYSYAGDQIIQALTYDKLVLSGSGMKYFDNTGGNTVVNTTLDYSSLSGNLSLDNDNLILNGTLIGTGAILSTGNSQMTFNNSGGGAIGTLVLDPTSSLNSLTLSNGNLTLGADISLGGTSPTISITSGTTLDAQSYVIKGPGTISLSGKIRTSNSNGLAGGSNTTFDSNITTPSLSSSTVEYYASSGTQAITAFVSGNPYNHLMLSGNSTKSFANSSYFINGDFTNIGSLPSINSGAIFTFGGSAQNIATATYPTVIFSGSGNKTLASGVTTIVSSMTVNGSAKVVTGGNLLLTSRTASSSAVLIDNTSSNGVIGNVTVERIVPAGRPGTPTINGLPIFLSAPVAGNLSLFQPTNSNFFYYNPLITTGSQFVRVSVSSPAVAGQGYCLRLPAGRKLSLAGAPNSGSITQNLIFGGDNFNLVGNPYPSAIVWDNSTIGMNNLGASNQIKFFDGSAYVVADIGTTIPMMQGFFVQAGASGASVTFTNAARSNSQNQLIRVDASSSLDNRTELWIHRGKNKRDMSVFWAQNNANSTVYNPLYDGNKSMPTDPQTPAIYFPKQKSNLDVYTFGLNENNLNVPFMVKLPKDTVYTIEFRNKERLNPAYSVYLIDSSLNIVHNLLTDNMYTFSGTTATGKRFRIMVSQATITEENNDSYSSQEVSIYSENGIAHLLTSFLPSRLSVKDLTGNTVYEANNLTSKNIDIDLNNNSNGVYIVSVENENQVINKKIAISR
ncbi:MAG: T9SS type A sorting domain-containing protein, partial [Cytophagales bacterium]|nr:T9SS type A sorting domain-containing protein [Cytophagales bacterium]